MLCKIESVVNCYRLREKGNVATLM